MALTTGVCCLPALGAAESKIKCRQVGKEWLQASLPASGGCLLDITPAFTRRPPASNSPLSRRTPVPLDEASTVRGRDVRFMERITSATTLFPKEVTFGGLTLGFQQVNLGRDLSSTRDRCLVLEAMNT